MSLLDPVASRGCYCAILKEKAPELLESRGLPPGFCGICEKCGAPGHICHFPGAVPYTGAWCDRHYRRLVLTDPRSPIGCVVWLVALLVAATAIFALLR